jgi:hypothetical protein
MTSGRLLPCLLGPLWRNIPARRKHRDASHRYRQQARSRFELATRLRQLPLGSFIVEAIPRAVPVQARYQNKRAPRPGDRSRKRQRWYKKETGPSARIVWVAFARGRARFRAAGLPAGSVWAISLAGSASLPVLSSCLHHPAGNSLKRTISARKNRRDRALALKLA